MKSYFSHDDNAFSDLKIIQLRAKYGLESYGFWWALIERFRIEKTYKLEYKNSIFSALKIYTNCSFNVKEIIDFCIEIELLVLESEFFFSKSLISRMELKDVISSKRKELGKIGAEKRWQTDSKPIAIAIDIDGKPIASKVKESKVKEKKVNKSIKSIDDFFSEIESEKLKSTLQDFAEMRNTIKKPLTANGLKLLIAKLDKLASSESEQIEILEESILNCWQGVFPLKSKIDNPKSVKHKESNYHERSKIDEKNLFEV